MSTVSRNCRNRLQRSQGGGETPPPFSGSRGPAPGTLRSLLSHDCSNSRRMVQPFSSDPPFCAADNIELAFASVRLCESEPRMMSVMKSAGACYSFKILAKIAASPGFHPVMIHVSVVPPPTPISLRSYRFKNGAETGHDRRASAQFFQHCCTRAEARQGYFPPLILRCIALAMPRRIALQHQTGPP
jgi:hypothetical protein